MAVIAASKLNENLVKLAIIEYFFTQFIIFFFQAREHSRKETAVRLGEVGVIPNQVMEPCASLDSCAQHQVNSLLKFNMALVLYANMLKVTK